MTFVTRRKGVLPSFGKCMLGCIIVLAATPAFSNGLGESRPWQFQSSGDRANKAMVADMIERKKGGYYDGFDTVVYNTNTTNIGSQVNCNTIADAGANVADNSQSGNDNYLSSDIAMYADSVGNTAGYTGSDGDAVASSSQESSGEVGSSVNDSSASSSTGGVSSGSTDNDLDNTQTNSGNLSASIADSVTCDLNGAIMDGWVDVNTGDIATNGGVLN